MRTSAIALALVALATPALADTIALYEEPYSEVCAKPSFPYQINNVYVVHTMSSGATGSSWRIDNTSGMIGVGSSCGQLTIDGDAFTGISIQYGGCLTGTFMICQLSLFNVSTGPIPDCYQLNVRGYPGDVPLVTDCNNSVNAATGGFFTFDIEGKQCWDCTTPVENHTWGRVKALYR